MNRTRRSMLNVAVALFTYAIPLVTAFLVQKVLVLSLGDDYNGINGLFSSIISMMSMTDLGIGTAIIYHMYRPMAERDSEKIKSLLKFYKYSYMVISGVVLLIGVVVAFFLPLLTDGAKIKENIYLIFVLFIFDCVCSYFLGYKKSMLYADMVNFIPDTIYFCVYMVQNALQIYVLLAFHSYIAFLIIKSMGKIVPNILISLYIRVKYPYTAEKNVKPLDSEVRNDIVKKVKGLFLHKIGKLIVTGSDSLVLTGVVGITAMNLYANYYLVIAGISALFNKGFETLSNSVGNFLLDSSKERNKDVFKKVEFLNFWLFGTAAVGMYAVMQPLIELWMGERFLFSETVLIVLVYNFYLQGVRTSVITFKEAAGIFHEDRFVPVIEAMLNLAVSIVLAMYLGVAGVFVGTIVSSLVVYLYGYPKYVCGPLFDMSFAKYLWGTVSHLLVLSIAILGIGGIKMTLADYNPWGRFFAGGIAAVLVSQIVFFAFYARSAEMRYYIGLIKGRFGDKASHGE
ncbi:MAG: hypothetical protein MJ107_01050 [Lachnospiraceae bacterium]|nr:hypothetical protein [Lachnospiraceae bacterium]